VVTLPQALARIKGELARLVPEALVRRLVADQSRAYRNRTLTPVVTAYLALRQVLHGHVSAAGLRHIAGLDFTPSAYGQARGRLSVGFFRALLRAVTGRLRADDPERPGDRWRGHRVWLMDGSSFSMPDAPELQETFGQPGGQAPGCGFPVAHLLLLVEASAGYVVRALAAPRRTHDLARAAAAHPALQPGDLLVGDRAFGSFAHLALLRQRGAHGLFRLHQRRRPGRRRDRRVTYRKPGTRPVWLTEAAYAALPDAVTVREVRVRVTMPGRRVREVILVTTLLDRRRYPAAALARLYERRWRVEVDLRHLKQTLGMDVLRSQSVPGVMKEMLAFVTVYNLVRRVMRDASIQQGVPAERISFVDALRWLRQARPGEAVPALVVNPERPGRFEPRVRKRRPKQYPLMKRPREVLKEELLGQNLAA
jgi:hypothetical protein